jgi:hypothetical protein
LLLKLAHRSYAASIASARNPLKIDVFVQFSLYTNIPHTV